MPIAKGATAITDRSPTRIVADSARIRGEKVTRRICYVRCRRAAHVFGRHPTKALSVHAILERLGRIVFARRAGRSVAGIGNRVRNRQTAVTAIRQRRVVKRDVAMRCARRRGLERQQH
jgi:hypothetical protein